MSKVVLKFPNDELRDLFLGLLSDGGISDSIYDAMKINGVRVGFDYSGAFPAWGWNGKGNPTVEIIDFEEDVGEDL